MNSQDRCKKYRKRILDISQQVQALHIGSAFSCTEIVDAIYHELMTYKEGSYSDTFLMSKGHGCMIQYVILESLGVLKKMDLDNYCKPGGILGCHPDYGNPGIAASTGALGHGLSMALGMAYAEKSLNSNANIYCVLSDGEVQEGSTWEATLMASSLGVNNLIAFIDNNNFQSLGKTSETHPSFYPVVEKYLAFGWESVEVDGHNTQAIISAVKNRSHKKPLMVNCKTIKGKGISFMENIPLWHYRSPSIEEYKLALNELNQGLK
jgi:transketolase